MTRQLWMIVCVAALCACGGEETTRNDEDAGTDVADASDASADTETDAEVDGTADIGGDADDDADPGDTDPGDARDDVVDATDAGDSGPADADMDVADDADATGDIDTTDVADATDAADAGDVGPMPYDPCPPLAPPTGTTITVSPGEADSLPGIVRDAASGTTILLEDGVYTMTSSDEGNRRLNFRTPNVTLRSASGNAEAVIINGQYQTLEMIAVLASDVTIAEITLIQAVDHPIHVTAEDQPVENTLIYGVRLIDNGEQFIKINPNGERTIWPDNGRIACTEMTLTDAGRPNIERNPGGCYTGGVDAHGIRGWTIEHNEIYDIYCAGEGLAEHGIHIWQGGRDNLIQNNFIFNCARGIGLGLREDGPRRIYDDDPGIGHLGEWGSIVRNNIIIGTHDYHDTGIEIAQVLDGEILHNTVVSTNETGFFSSIDIRFANTQVDLINNLTRRISYRNDGSANAMTNLEGVNLSYFENPGMSDWHLASTATDAIDTGTVVVNAGLDMDGEPRGSSPDIGADERPE